MENLKEEDFEIEVATADNKIQLKWKGSLHAANPGDFLEPFFEQLINQARADASAVECDFSSLEYMNSASIPPLIQLLRNLAELEIKGEFIYDSSRKVQAASFRALDVIASKSEYTTVRGV